MNLIIKKYGKTTEITDTQKSPSKICVPITRKRKDIYGARRRDNIRRTRQICMRRVSVAIEDFGSPLLVTLTFKGDASDASYANDSLRSFQVRLQARYTNAQWVFVPELSPKGRIHFHGLIFNLPMCLGDKTKGRRVITYGTERNTRELCNIWREGFVDVKQTDGSPRLAGYISKYITKSKGEVMFNAMKLIRVSRGIRKEEIYRGQVAEDMQKSYSDIKPDYRWDGRNRYQGFIIKKIYQDSEENRKKKIYEICNLLQEINRHRR